MPSYYQRVAEILKLERPRGQPSGSDRSTIGPGVIKRVLRWTIGVLIFVAILTYACDYGVLRYRMARGTGLGSVTVDTYYAIHQKNGKTEFQTLDPQPQTCVNSLFPHQGITPCWYLSRHPEKRIDI